MQILRGAEIFLHMSNVATAHPTAAELWGIPIKIKVIENIVMPYWNHTISKRLITTFVDTALNKNTDIFQLPEKLSRCQARHINYSILFTTEPSRIRTISYCGFSQTHFK